ncbi:MAG: DUF4124 domain-containing protein [Burkholderiaceae bacterium]
MRQLCLTALICLLATPAMAQYQWVDRSGQMVFSDQPPPVTVPMSRILRVGDPIAKPVLPARKTGVGNADNAPKSRAEKLAERIKEHDDRREKRAESKKKDREAKLASAAKARRCSQLKSRMTSINSGVRMTRSGQNGERAFLSDKERAALGKQTRKHLSACS